MRRTPTAQRARATRMPLPPRRPLRPCMMVSPPTASSISEFAFHVPVELMTRRRASTIDRLGHGHEENGRGEGRDRGGGGRPTRGRRRRPRMPSASSGSPPEGVVKTITEAQSSQPRRRTAGWARARRRTARKKVRSFTATLPTRDGRFPGRRAASCPPRDFPCGGADGPPPPRESRRSEGSS